MNTLSRFRLIAILPFLLMAVGCSSVNFQNPSISQVNLSNVSNVTPDGMTLNFNVAVNNPNAYALPIETTDYKLGVANVPVINNSAVGNSSLPASGVGALQLPITVRFAELVKLKSALASSGGDVPYMLDAGVSFNPPGFAHLMGMRAVRVPFTHSDTLHLKQILQDNWTTLLQSDSAAQLMAAVMGR